MTPDEELDLDLDKLKSKKEKVAEPLSSKPSSDDEELVSNLDKLKSNSKKEESGMHKPTAISSSDKDKPKIKKIIDPKVLISMQRGASETPHNPDDDIRLQPSSLNMAAGWAGINDTDKYTARDIDQAKIKAKANEAAAAKKEKALNGTVIPPSVEASFALQPERPYDNNGSEPSGLPANITRPIMDWTEGGSFSDILKRKSDIGDLETGGPEQSVIFKDDNNGGKGEVGTSLSAIPSDQEIIEAAMPDLIKDLGGDDVVAAKKLKKLADKLAGKGAKLKDAGLEDQESKGEAERSADFLALKTNPGSIPNLDDEDFDTLKKARVAFTRTTAAKLKAAGFSDDFARSQGIRASNSILGGPQWWQDKATRDARMKEPPTVYSVGPFGTSEYPSGTVIESQGSRALRLLGTTSSAIGGVFGSAMEAVTPGSDLAKIRSETGRNPTGILPANSGLGGVIDSALINIQTGRGLSDEFSDLATLAIKSLAKTESNPLSGHPLISSAIPDAYYSLGLVTDLAAIPIVPGAGVASGAVKGAKEIGIAAKAGEELSKGQKVARLALRVLDENPISKGGLKLFGKVPTDMKTIIATSALAKAAKAGEELSALKAIDSGRTLTEGEKIALQTSKVGAINDLLKKAGSSKGLSTIISEIEKANPLISDTIKDLEGVKEGVKALGVTNDIGKVSLSKVAKSVQTVLAEDPVLSKMISEEIKAGGLKTSKDIISAVLHKDDNLTKVAISMAAPDIVSDILSKVKDSSLGSLIKSDVQLLTPRTAVYGSDVAKKILKEVSESGVAKAAITLAKNPKDVEARAILGNFISGSIKASASKVGPAETILESISKGTFSSKDANSIIEFLIDLKAPGRGAFSTSNEVVGKILTEKEVGEITKLTNLRDGAIISGIKKILKEDWSAKSFISPELQVIVSKAQGALGDLDKIIKKKTSEVIQNWKSLGFKNSPSKVEALIYLAIPKGADGQGWKDFLTGIIDSIVIDTRRTAGGAIKGGDLAKAENWKDDGKLLVKIDSFATFLSKDPTITPIEFASKLEGFIKDFGQGLDTSVHFDNLKITASVEDVLSKVVADNIIDELRMASIKEVVNLVPAIPTSVYPELLPSIKKISKAFDLEKGITTESVVNSLITSKVFEATFGKGWAEVISDSNDIAAAVIKDMKDSGTFGRLDEVTSYIADKIAAANFPNFTGSNDEELFDEILSKIEGLEKGDDLTGDASEGTRLLEELYSKSKSGLKSNFEKILKDKGLKSGLAKAWGAVTSLQYNAMLYFRPRFHGANILTAPFIMMQTLGGDETAKILWPTSFINGFYLSLLTSLREEWIPAWFLSKEAFKDIAGRSWKVGEVIHLIKSSSIVRSQTGIIAADDVLKSNASIIAGWGNKDNLLTKVGEGISNLYSFPSEFATFSDGVFRISTLIHYLKEGKIPATAIDAARESLFDYSKMSEFEKTYIKNWFLFYSFQRQSAATFLRNVLENPTRIANMAKIASFHPPGKDYRRSLFYEPEWYGSRPMFGKKRFNPSVRNLDTSVSNLPPEVVAYYAKGIWGPQIPGTDFITLAANVIALPFGSSDYTSDSLSGLTEKGSPVIKALFLYKEDEDSVVKYGHIDPRHIALLKKAGLFEWAQVHFGIVTITNDDLRWKKGRTTFKPWSGVDPKVKSAYAEIQYGLVPNSAGAKSWATMLRLASAAGSTTFINDWIPICGVDASDIVTPGTDIDKDFLEKIGFVTTGSLEDPKEIFAKVRDQKVKSLNK